MKRVLFICCLFFSLQSQGQDWNNLHSLMASYVKAGAYQEAIPIGKQLIDQARKEFGEDHLNYVLSLNRLISVYKKLSQYEPAIPLLKEVIRLRKKLLSEYDYLVGVSLMDLADTYYFVGKYADAEACYFACMKIDTLTTGVDHTDHAITLSNLGELYRQTSQYEKALPLLLRAQGIYRSHQDTLSQPYAKVVNNLGLLYLNTGEFPLAEQMFITSGEIDRTTIGLNDPEHTPNLINLGVLYQQMGRYSTADSVLKAAQRLLENLHLEETFYFDLLSSCRAALYQKMGNFELAAPLFEKAKALTVTLLGVHHVQYGLDLNNLGLLYGQMGQFDLAENYFLSAQQVFRETVGVAHENYALVLNNLGELNRNLSNYDRAFGYYEQARLLWEKRLGTAHPAYLTLCNNIALLWMNKGDYVKAEPLLQQVVEGRKKLLGMRHPDVAEGISNLGELYRILGQYTKAESLYNSSLTTWRLSMDTLHSSYARMMNNLALVYAKTGRFIESAQYYQRAIQVWTKVVGINHADVALCKGNLAELYRSISWIPKETESLYQQALAIWRKLNQQDQPGYALLLNNLASFYLQQKEYKKAEPLYEEALSKFGRLVGVDHVDYGLTLSNLGQLYMLNQQYKKSEPLLLKATDIAIDNLSRVFPSLSEKEKVNYINNNVRLIQNNNTLLYRVGQSDSLSRTNFELQLFFKSLVLDNTRSLLHSVREMKDTSISIMFSEWYRKKKILAKQYSLPASQRLRKLDSLEAASEELEKRLSRKLLGTNVQLGLSRIRTNAMQQALDSTEACIEFVRFQLATLTRPDSVIYGAYLLRKKDNAPVFIPLFEEKQLNYLLQQARKLPGGLAVNCYRGLEPVATSTSTIAYELGRIIWQPIMPYLAGISRIAYAPAGMLYNLSLPALLVDSTDKMIDRFELNQYLNTREIIGRSGEQPIKPTSIALFGNATFNMDSAELVKKRKVAVQKNYTVVLPDIDSSYQLRNGFDSLPGTAVEIDRIASLFTRHQLENIRFAGTNATEESLKSLSGKSPGILHIATHGFFLPPKKDRRRSTMTENVYSIAEDPLLRSGLILSGGSYVWSGHNPIDGIDDGIVTAYEISQLDLSQTELVVLSACETGLGDIDGNEGVWGLQRAFKMAGVKKMILSLWQVPDLATSELMILFYQHWLDDKLTIDLAFRTAQQDMQKKYPTDPSRWAGFVLIE